MSSTAALDQDALANLTPEEREAFNEPEYNEQERAALQRLAGDAGDDDGDPDEVLDANGNPVAAAKDPVKEEPKANADVTDVVAKASEPAAAAQVQTDPKPEPQAVYKAELPEDFEAKVADIKQKTTDLRAQFKAGDIDFDTFEAKKSELDDARESLMVARTKAELSQEMTAQSAEAQWRQSINALFANVLKTEGVDYQNDMARQTDLDTFVKALANNTANQDKSPEWFLAEAHKRVNALHGSPAPAAAPAPAAKAQNRTPPAAPKSIAGIPGGEGPGDVGSEFASVDALAGDDLEAAIARMTPAQREKFSRGQ